MENERKKRESSRWVSPVSHCEVRHVYAPAYISLRRYIQNYLSTHKWGASKERIACAVLKQNPEFFFCWKEVDSIICCLEDEGILRFGEKTHRYYLNIGDSAAAYD